MVKYSGSKLPQKPSSLIRIAVKDMRRIALEDGYVFNMSTFHIPMLDDRTGKVVCNLCFAGAVMAGMAKMPKNDDYCLTNTDREFENKMAALDSFRSGSIANGLSYLQNRRIDRIARNNAAYISAMLDRYNGIKGGKAVIFLSRDCNKKAGRERFLKKMLRMANDFEKIGL